MLTLCSEHLSKEAAKDVFVLTYDRMRRFEGAWHMEVKPLFPSYLFFDSEDGELLEGELSRIPFGRNGIIKISQNLEPFLKCLYRGSRHLQMSTGVIQDGVPQITAGPLKGMEQSICKIDRHRRLARLTVPVGQRRAGLQMQKAAYRQDFGYITAGLEITKKNMQTEVRNTSRSIGT